MNGARHRAWRLLALGLAVWLALSLEVALAAQPGCPSPCSPPSPAEADALASAYLALGGRDAVGPLLGPSFRRGGDEALYLAAAGVVLQTTRDGRAAPAPVMEWLTAAGKDDWLESVRGIPRRQSDTSVDAEPVPTLRRAWLTQPNLRETYLAEGEEAALRRWGLPTSRPERFGPFISQRFERGVLQLWIDEVPGAPPPGTVVSVLVGDLLVEAGALTLPARPRLPSSVAPGSVQVAAPSADMVAITFDMGSIDDGLADVLDALHQRGLVATFFVTGDFVRRFPWALPRIIALGHEVANHTVTHPDLTTYSTGAAAREVDALDALLVASGAPPPIWFRPPFGAYDRRVASILAGRGYPLMMWRVDLADWRSDIDVEDVVRIGGRIRAGDIVVTHGGLPKTAAAIPRVLDGLAARGLRQVTLSALYGS